MIRDRTELENRENKGVANGADTERSSTVLSAYERIVESLKAKNIPDIVNHREKEKSKITNFLQYFLVEHGTGTNTLIITGKPGAGKTLLVSNLLANLEKQQFEFFPKSADSKPELTQKNKKQIYVIQMNAMSYSLCFPLLLECVSKMFKIGGLHFDSAVYKNGTYLIELLKMKSEELFRERTFILLIDELDTLAKHDQKNFELINDLLNIPNNGFLKIGISNTLDLFAKYKGTKKYVECRQMAFTPYGEKELAGILRDRVTSALSGTNLKSDVIMEGPVMAKICTKIHKNAFGDIRAMLSLMEKLFERKLDNLKRMIAAKSKGLSGKDADIDLPISELKITLADGITMVDKNYGNKQAEILSTLSLSLQTCLVALYYAAKDKSTMEAFNTNLKQCYENLGISSAHQDVQQNLSTLETYSYIKLHSKVGKSKGPIQTSNIELLVDSKDLRDSLEKIPALSIFFPSEDDVKVKN